VKRVLIIDDEFGILEALADVLGDQGYEVSMARNGRDGLKRVDEARPDLIVVDYMMPVMDGVQLIEELRKRGDASIPVVLMTAVRRELLPAGLTVDAYLAKPFGIDELIDVVKKHLK